MKAQVRDMGGFVQRRFEKRKKTKRTWVGKLARGTGKKILSTGIQTVETEVVIRVKKGSKKKDWGESKKMTRIGAGKKEHYTCWSMKGKEGAAGEKHLRKNCNVEVVLGPKGSSSFKRR